MYIVSCGVMLLLHVSSNGDDNHWHQNPDNAPIAPQTSGELNKLRPLLETQGFLEHEIKTKWISQRITR